MPVEDYDKGIGRTPEERARAARTLDHVGELLRKQGADGLVGITWPPTENIRKKFEGTVTPPPTGK